MTEPLPFDATRLETYVKDTVAGLDGPLTLTPIAGGQSNPTYFMDVGGKRFVLRKQPTGNLMPSAHAVDREHRIIQALAGSDVPVPPVTLMCTDTSVIGTMFYVMERVEGRVFHDCTLPGVTREDRAAMYGSVGQTLARLHGADWRAAGLESFGKSGNYFARQISRWSRQWQSDRTKDIPGIDRLVEWLPKNIPDDDLTTIVHGDYRIGNMMFHPTEPRVVAVLDWELSTLGHPMADLAFLALLYHSRPDEYGGIMGLDREGLGIPAEEGLLEHYYAASGRELRLTPFHTAFAMFRFAVIFEGIAARAAKGTAAAANAQEVGRLSTVFGTRGWQVAQGAPFVQ